MKKHLFTFLGICCLLWSNFPLLGQTTGTINFNLGAFNTSMNNNDGSSDGTTRPSTNTTTSGSQPATSGGGIIVSDIALNLPSSGKMLAEPYTLFWKDRVNNNMANYKVTIMNVSTGEPIMEAHTSGTELLVDFSGLNLMKGEEYSCQVSGKSGSKTIVSKEAFFTLAEPNLVSDIDKDLSNQSSFSNGSKYIQHLMKAFQLEQNQLYAASQSFYLEAVKNAVTQRDAFTAMNMLNTMKNTMF